jgi:pimeloyl-ACP methyl ester carboxylesterase
MADEDRIGLIAETSSGPVEYLDNGRGDAVLFVHGSPGGCDEGELMTRFVVAAGYRVIAPSRPGYLATPLTDDNASPDQQAELHLALLDSLGIKHCALMFWSGGGPSSYRLATQHAHRVSRLVAIAAVSKAYKFAGGVDGALLEGRIGHWLVKEMAKHSPKTLVKSTVGEEGDLDKQQLKRLVEEIWEDDTKRDFVLSLAEIVAGRKTGLENDRQQFPKIEDLGLAGIQQPVLLVHGTVDADVPPVYSDFAQSQLPNADRYAIEGGTHLSVWAGPDADGAQERIVEFLNA